MTVKELIHPSEKEMKCEEVQELYDILSLYSTYSSLYYGMGIAWGDAMTRTARNYIDRIFKIVQDYQVTNSMGILDLIIH